MTSRVMEGHGREFLLQLRDDLAHSLGSARRSRNHVPGSLSAIVPQFPEGPSSGVGSDDRTTATSLSP